MAEEEKKEVKEEVKEEQQEEKTKEEPQAEKKEEKKEVKEDTPKEEEEEVVVPEKFKDIVEKVEKMTVLDLAELVKILEKKFGVSAAAPMAAAPAAASNGPADGGEEKSEFNIQLAAPGEKKIDVIKVVRDVTGQGLKESKDMVDAAANEPQTVKEGVKKEEAEEIKKKFEAAGAKVELK